VHKKKGIYVPEDDFGTYIHIRKRKHCLVTLEILQSVIRKEKTYSVAVWNFVSWLCTSYSETSQSANMYQKWVHTLTFMFLCRKHNFY